MLCTICKKKFLQRRLWQRTCGDKACTKEYERRLQVKWRKTRKSHKKEGIRTYQEGRRCKKCKTILSIYNKTSVCYACQKKGGN